METKAVKLQNYQKAVHETYKFGGSKIIELNWSVTLKTFTLLPKIYFK